MSYNYVYFAHKTSDGRIIGVYNSEQAALRAIKEYYMTLNFLVTNQKVINQLAEKQHAKNLQDVVVIRTHLTPSQNKDLDNVSTDLVISSSFKHLVIPRDKILQDGFNTVWYTSSIAKYEQVYDTNNEMTTDELVDYLRKENNLFTHPLNKKQIEDGSRVNLGPLFKVYDSDRTYKQGLRSYL